MTEKQTKYRRCLVLAGGGGRLGLHLGTYAAACEAGLAPDVLLGTCGGALAAALIHAEPDPARQLAYLAGPEMYRFWGSVKPHLPSGLGKAMAALVLRALDPRHAPRVPDLDRDALFKVEGPWPELHWRHDGAGPDAVVLGARLMYDAAHIGQPRAGRRLLQPVAIGPARACALLADAPSAVGTGPHAGSAIAPVMAVADTSALSLQDAVRISMTDMIYLPAAEAAGARWLGGAVDLLPGELAAELADEVWIDRKSLFEPWTFAAAWRSVLGIDARRRQRQIHRLPAALRIDHRGVDDLLTPALSPKLHFAAGRLRLSLSTSADEADYRRLIQAQFDEGHRRAKAALALLPSHPKTGA